MRAAVSGERGRKDTSAKEAKKHLPALIEKIKLDKLYIVPLINYSFTNLGFNSYANAFIETSLFMHT